MTYSSLDSYLPVVPVHYQEYENGLYSSKEKAKHQWENVTPNNNGNIIVVLLPAAVSWSLLWLVTTQSTLLRYFTGVYRLLSLILKRVLCHYTTGHVCRQDRNTQSRWASCCSFVKVQNSSQCCLHPVEKYTCCYCCAFWVDLFHTIHFTLLASAG